MTSTTATVHSELFPDSSAPARCEVVVIDGPDRGRAAALRDGPVTIGSDPGCELVLTDERVSRRHLELAQEGKRFTARDLGSTNGTLVNGAAVDRARLRDCDVIVVGITELVYHEPRG